MKRPLRKPKLTKKTFKKDPKRALATFKEEYKAIRGQLGVEAGDYQHDKASQSFLRATLVMLNNMIPVAEEAYLKEPKQSHAYTLSTLISQAREVMNDLRAVQDAESQVEYINETILTNAWKMILNNISTEYTTLSLEINTLLVGNPKKATRVLKAVNNLLSSHGRYMSEVDAKIKSDVQKYLLTE